MKKASKQNQTDNAIGIYTHVPFCASTCDFCHFYQEKPKRQELDRYLNAIESELSQSTVSEPVKTIFWGGGTPGLLPAADLERLGSMMIERFDFVDGSGAPSKAPLEWTIEMAPSTVKPDKIKVLKDLGVTRISMGVQSFNADLLNNLGRLHNPKQIYSAYDTLKESGFENINLDLIFAIPGQSEADWLSDLNEAIRLNPEHISTYCLTFEEDTALWVKLSQGKIKRNIENEAELYTRTWKTLEDNGYPQYEVSNFSKPGRACQHNIDTWRMKEWYGFGPSAASQYHKRRFSNPSSLDIWQEGVEKGAIDYVDESTLDDEILAVDSVIFGLRMNKGIDLCLLKERFPSFDFKALEPTFSLWESEALLTQKGSCVRLTNKGRLLADQIGEQILSQH